VWKPADPRAFFEVSVQGVEDVTGSAAAADRPVEVLPVAAEQRWSVREQYRRLYRRMAVTDVLVTEMALLLAYWVRFGFRIPRTDFLWLLAATPVLLIGIFAMLRLYDVHHFTPAEEFRRIILAVSLLLTALVTVSFWSQSSFSRAWIALSWALALVAEMFSRRVWHWHIGRARERGEMAFRTLIVGTNGEAHHLEQVMRRPDLGYKPLGYISTGRGGTPPDGLPLVGEVADLREIIRTTDAECVFVAASELAVPEMSHVAKVVRLEGVEVRVTATLPEVLSSRLSVQPLGGVMALSLRQARLTGGQMVAKRIFDLVVAGLGTIITLPLSIAIAIAVKVTSPGPVLYRQRRVGQRGRPFTMLKFRTMKVGAEDMLEDLRSLNEADGPLFKLREDPRVTRVGRWLRKWSLDELPQLLNVIAGDMSLVGPRPPLPAEVREYEEWQFDRLEVQPGVTGLWQVSGRSDLSFDEYVRLDLFYIENWSLAYDLFIVAKTIPQLLARRGAY
jgi:exopolysaccharide biosynthesis polyprenyl glycosylphosphotransferase